MVVLNWGGELQSPCICQINVLYLELVYRTVGTLEAGAERVCDEGAAIQMIGCSDGFWRWPTTGRVSLALICWCGSILPALGRAVELLH